MIQVIRKKEQEIFDCLCMVVADLSHRLSRRFPGDVRISKMVLAVTRGGYPLTDLPAPLNTRSTWPETREDQKWGG
jgi:hypothetical protein